MLGKMRVVRTIAQELKRNMNALGPILQFAL